MTKTTLLAYSSLVSTVLKVEKGRFVKSLAASVELTQSGHSAVFSCAPIVLIMRFWLLSTIQCGPATPAFMAVAMWRAGLRCLCRFGTGCLGNLLVLQRRNPRFLLWLSRNQCRLRFQGFYLRSYQQCLSRFPCKCLVPGNCFRCRILFCSVLLRALHRSLCILRQAYRRLMFGKG